MNFEQVKNLKDNLRTRQMEQVCYVLVRIVNRLDVQGNSSASRSENNL